MTIIETRKKDLGFAEQVERLSRANLNRCWHCLTCSGGCPLSEDMDVLPNAVIRMIQFGMKAQVLKSSTIWLCVGCHTCSVECPNGVDMAAIMDVLRQMAVRENREIAEPGILTFHNAVVNSISKYGRTHKLDIMMRYKLASRDFFSDVDLGLKMLSKRKLDLLPSKVKDRQGVRSLFEKAGVS